MDKYSQYNGGPEINSSHHGISQIVFKRRLPYLIPNSNLRISNHFRLMGKYPMVLKKYNPICFEVSEYWVIVKYQGQIKSYIRRSAILSALSTHGCIAQSTTWFDKHVLQRTAAQAVRSSILFIRGTLSIQRKKTANWETRATAVFYNPSHPHLTTKWVYSYDHSQYINSHAIKFMRSQWP